MTVWGNYHFGEIAQGETAVYGVDADCAFADPRRCGLVEGLAHQGPGFGFLVRSDAVFEIVGHAVGG